jgi:hypothetical protein
MTEQELAYTEIERLVKSFKGMPAPQRKGMNEMQTRLGYILPLFKALGWDTSNINEVSPEEKVSRGWVDFSFEKSAHDEIVGLVERMLALQKERQSVRREDDLDRVRNLERQIAQVDAEIDRRVYALYGLTEDDIKVVEGG